MSSAAEEGHAGFPRGEACARPGQELLHVAAESVLRT